MFQIWQLYIFIGVLFSGEVPADQLQQCVEQRVECKEVIYRAEGLRDVWWRIGP